MSVVRRFRWAFTFAVVIVCVATVVAGAAVTDIERLAEEPAPNPPTVSPAGPLVLLTDLEPGDTRSTNFSVGNPNSAQTLAKVGGRLTSGSQALYSRLVAELSAAGDGVLWRGTLDQFTGSTTALTSIAAGSNKPMTLTITVPPDLDDSFQSLTSRFSLDFALSSISSALAERVPPISRWTSIKPGRNRLKKTISIRKLRKKRVKLYGRATDSESGVARVEVSLMKIGNRGRRERLCRSWNPAKKKYKLFGTRSGSCKRPLWFNAVGTDQFRLTLNHRMIKRGRYILRVRAIDKANNFETKLSPRKRNVFRFRIR